MEVFEAALAEATTRWKTAEAARIQAAKLSKEADARDDQERRTYYWREATKLQNDMIKYAAAISALRAILGK